MIVFVKVMRQTITVTCNARKKNKTKHSVKNGRRLIELLIYSLYFDTISYHDQLFSDIVNVFMHSICFFILKNTVS